MKEQREKKDLFVEDIQIEVEKPQRGEVLKAYFEKLVKAKEDK